ncbi:hypothetical protein B0T22DRAFT_267819 [Podospora appendiculata]|uniref:Uncharacterized protein n=1 Tax=Podospora appendiculata TaxID=314037 RepID=A0AAE0X398_9PEZI|nr:hypothetical protein B0T22DRAFT_267819 [Podospora appendiculata]
MDTTTNNNSSRDRDAAAGRSVRYANDLDNAVAVFKKFDAYPWTRDRPFLQGLVAMLGPLPNGSERQTALGICLQARIWWYKSRLNIEIDRSAYEAYLASSADPSRPDPDLLTKIEEIQRRMGVPAPAPGPPLPAWQLDAPKVDPTKKADDLVSHGGDAGSQDAPYPAHFQAIIDAVTTGKPVPGVREIPNTVVRQPGIFPVGKMQAPQKPWEKQQGTAVNVTAMHPAAETDSGDATLARALLDQEFPPV